MGAAQGTGAEAAVVGYGPERGTSKTSPGGQGPARDSHPPALGKTTSCFVSERRLPVRILEVRETQPSRASQQEGLRSSRGSEVKLTVSGQVS